MSLTFVASGESTWIYASKSNNIRPEFILD